MRIVANLIAHLFAAVLALVAVQSAASAECTVRVDFGSYRCGIDMETQARIEAYIAASGAIVHAGEFPQRGMEGEVSLCLEVDDIGSKRRVFEDLKAIVPAESKRAPTTVAFENGEAYGTQWPAKSLTRPAIELAPQQKSRSDEAN